MANGEVTTGKVIALIRALSSTSSATYTVTDALVIGAATTSGVRLDLESGDLAVREGDDSAYANLRVLNIFGYSAGNHLHVNGTGVDVGSAVQFRWSSTPAVGAIDTGLARDSAGQVKVTDGSTGVGNLRATALIVGTADTNGVRLDLDSGALGVRLGDDSGYAKVDCGSLVVSDYVQAGRYIKAGYFEINGATGYDVMFREPYTTSSTNVHQVTASSGALSGASYSFSNALPAGAIILGVTVRVTTKITGATSFDVGDGTDVDRYGAAIALASGTTTTFASATATPLEWRSDNGNVVLTANGSDFTGGVVRICVHYLSGTAPSS